MDAPRVDAAAASCPPRVTVLVDGWFIDRAYGFGRYVRELLRALELHAPDVAITVLVTPAGESTARALVSRGRVEVMPERSFPVWEQWVVPRAARRLGVDLVHFPYQSSAWAWPRSASVMTVHDLIPFDPVPWRGHRMEVLSHLYRRWAMRLWGRRSARLVAVSAQTQAQLRERLGVASEVVPNVVDGFASSGTAAPGPVAASDPAAGEPARPYLLHRGGDAAHKNTARVLRAFEAIRSRVPELELRVFGMTAPAAIAAIEGVRWLGRVDDPTLAALYRGAIAVVAPSLVEGFGLSLIEAFAFDAPLVTATRPPMSEIAGEDAALLVDPESDEQIALAMLRVVTDPALRATLVEAGRRRLAAYDAGDVARRLQAAYLDAAAARRTRPASSPAAS